MENKIKFIKLKCPNTVCNNIWDYKGTKLRATCTSCGNKINVKANTVND